LYIGKIVNGKEEITDFLTGVRRDKDESEWKIVDRPDLAIISPELYAKAQETLSRRHTAFKITGERHSNKHLFSTLIKCADCGYSFRRMVLTYKNTYTRWVCSGRNAKGTGSCDNRTSMDEGELVEALREYYTNVLLRKPGIIKHVVKEFTGIYKAQDANEQRKDDLEAELAKTRTKREGVIDMYTDGAITRDEMRNKMSGMNAAIEKMENELKLISYNLSKGDQLEDILSKTFSTVEDIVSLESMTNAQLKQNKQKIVVTHDGNVDIFMRLFGDIGLDETFLIFPHQTQRRNRTSDKNKPQAGG
jgi:predicted transcriptional regulator